MGGVGSKYTEVKAKHDNTISGEILVKIENQLFVSLIRVI